MNIESKESIGPFASFQDNLYSYPQPRTTFNQILTQVSQSPHQNIYDIRNRCIKQRKYKEKDLSRNNSYNNCSTNIRKRGNRLEQNSQHTFINYQHKYRDKNLSEQPNQPHFDVKIHQNHRKETQVLKDYLKRLMESTLHSKKDSQFHVDIDKNEERQDIHHRSMGKMKLYPIGIFQSQKNQTPIHLRSLKPNVKKSKTKILKHSIKGYPRRQQFRFSQKIKPPGQNVVLGQQINAVNIPQNNQLLKKLQLQKNWRSPTKQSKEIALKPIKQAINQLRQRKFTISGQQSKTNKQNLDNQVYENIHIIKYETLSNMIKTIKFS